MAAQDGSGVNVMERRSRRQWLEKASLIYVFVPCLIFGLGWLRPVLGVPYAILLLIGMRHAFRSLDDAAWPPEEASEETTDAFSVGIRYALILGLVTVVTVLSGIGGYAFQVADYAAKHNTFMRDFIDYPWPLAYAQQGKNASGPLVTYIAFYLPAALVGKGLGWDAANLFSLAWAIAGLYMAVLWFLRLAGKFSVRFTLLFLFFGGLDILGWLLLNKSFFPVDRHVTLDYWLGHAAEQDTLIRMALGSVKWFYQSNMAFLNQSCHHLFPGMILVLMSLHEAMRRKTFANLPFLWAAAPLGSVFVAIGLVPYLLVAFVTTRGKGLFSFQNTIAAPVILLVHGLFFLSNNAQYPHGWIWEFQRLSSSWILLLIFYLVEFGIYVAVCPADLEKPGSRPDRIWWWTAIACLIFLPWYKLGTYSDLSAKAALPSLLMLQVYLASTIRNSTTASEKNWSRLLVLLLVIGAFSGLNELTRGLGNPVRPLSPPYESIRHLPQLPGQDVAEQLFGNPEAFFWKHLAKPLELH